MRITLERITIQRRQGDLVCTAAYSAVIGAGAGLVCRLEAGAVDALPEETRKQLEQLAGDEDVEKAQLAAVSARGFPLGGVAPDLQLHSVSLTKKVDGKTGAGKAVLRFVVALEEDTRELWPEAEAAGTEIEWRENQ